MRIYLLRLCVLIFCLYLPHSYAAETTSNKQVKKHFIHLKDKTQQEMENILKDANFHRAKTIRILCKALIEIDKDIQNLEDNLKRTTHTLSIESKEKIIKKLGELRKARSVFSGHLVALQHASSRSWGELKKGLDKAWKELTSAFDELSKENENQ